MSYVHLRNALFLQPLPELPSVPSSQQPTPDRVGSAEIANLPPLSGIFTSATVPKSLMANPLGAGTPGRSPPSISSVSTNRRKAGPGAGGALEPVVLQGDTDEVCVCVCVRAYFGSGGCDFASPLLATYVPPVVMSRFPSAFSTSTS